MKRSGKIFLLLALLLLAPRLYPAGTGPEETNRQILAALNAGNADDLSKYFNAMVDLGITGTEDSYSKTQAARILGEFFTKNPVKSVKILKQGTSNDGSQFSIGEMAAGNKTYRIFYLLKKETDNYLIQQFQIEETN